MADRGLFDAYFDLTQPTPTGNDVFPICESSDSLFFGGFEATDAGNAYPEPVIPYSPPAHQQTELSRKDDATTTTGNPLSSISSPSRTNCLCSEMLCIFESIEVCLSQDAQRAINDTVRNRSENMAIPLGLPSSPSLGRNEMLTCQKEVLRSCEKWLSWDASRIQSQHAVLMVSIFDRLLASIQSIPEASLHETRNVNVNTDPPTWYSADNSTGAGGNGSDHSLQADQWNMDDEERIHVLKSLLSLRASRLKVLLERLGAIAASNQWPVQTNMVRDLLDRLAKGRDLL